MNVAVYSKGKENICTIIIFSIKTKAIFVRV